jgi:hypothetical protein
MQISSEGHFLQRSSSCRFTLIDTGNWTTELWGEEGLFSRWLWVCTNRKIQGMVWSWHGVNGAGMCKKNSITNYMAPCSMCSAPVVLVFVVCAFDMSLLLWGFVKSFSTIQCLFMVSTQFFVLRHQPSSWFHAADILGDLIMDEICALQILQHLNSVWAFCAWIVWKIAAAVKQFTWFC